VIVEGIKGVPIIETDRGQEKEIIEIPVTEGVIEILEMEGERSVSYS
jgi:hypothetical protein